jgi:hypothetical protein
MNILFNAATPLQHCKHLCVTALLALLLVGCQSPRQQITDCKAGDWVAIGHRDGHTGLVPTYNERKVFCSAYAKDAGKTDTAADYQSGWTQGSWDLWSETGHSDGINALPVAQIETHIAIIPKEHAPANRPAYESGWLTGNSAYWQAVGTQAGNTGVALSQINLSRTDASNKNIRFDEAAYTNGWNNGNRSYWQNAGFQDAHNGIPDSQIIARTAAAKATGVLVQKEIYLAAWNNEIVNYWKNLGTLDAVSGKDFAMRRSEAHQKGLKIFEAEYRQSWEERLAIYWTQVGNEDGYGHPFQLEDRINNATRDLVFVIARSRDLYTAAWNIQNTRYCNIDDAFAHGQRNDGMAINVCKDSLQGQLKRAYLSGQDYQVVSAKHDHALSEIDEYTRKVNDAHRRLEQLEDEMRSTHENKQRVVNDDTIRHDKQREQEHHELDEQMDRNQQKLNEARRWEDQYRQQMLKLKRDIYLN